MKKYILSMVLLLLLLGLSGCTKKVVHLSADDEITVNTLLMKRDGTLQVAIVENFNKQYYNLNELNEFVSKEIKTYSDSVGSGKVTIEDLSVKKNNAVMLLNYAGMEHYSNFNRVAAAYFSTSTENVSLDLPTTYMNTNGTIVDKETAFKNGKYRVLVVYEPYEVIVDGDVKFVSKNTTILSNNKVKTKEDELNVIIYKLAN